MPFILLQVYDRICSFLSLQDIMLLIHTLECLYSLSSLGEKACNSIVHVHGAIDMLVSLVTVEVRYKFCSVFFDVTFTFVRDREHFSADLLVSNKVL